MSKPQDFPGKQDNKVQVWPNDSRSQVSSNRVINLCEVFDVLHKFFSLSLLENPEFILYAERTSIWRYFLNDGTKEQLPIEGPPAGDCR